MKITNKHIMTRLFYVFSFIIILLIILISFFLLLNCSHKERLYVPCGLLLIVATMVIFRLKVFELEDSGEVFTIRTFHPASRKINYHLFEFPSRKLKTHEIRKTAFGFKLHIILESSKVRIVGRVFSLYLLSSEQLGKLRNSLESSKDKQ